MTQKHWNIWQGKINQTKSINGFFIWIDSLGTERKRSTSDLFNGFPYKITHSKFNNDTVELTIEISKKKLNSETRIFETFTEIEHITLDRKNISSIEYTK